MNYSNIIDLNHVSVNSKVCVAELTFFREAIASASVFERAKPDEIITSIVNITHNMLKSSLIIILYLKNTY